MNAPEIFLKGVWSNIPDEEKINWVDRVAEQPLDDSPLGDFGEIIREMKSKGIEDRTIARFAKIIGYETAFGICYQLEDPESCDMEEENEVSWCLFETNPDDDSPKEMMTGLHEMMLAFDPSGLEMRPSPKA